MSDILIRGMKMPTSCEECQTVLGCIDGSEGGTVWCRLAHGYIGDERTVCPLGSVLTPHGRLIDADVLADIFRGWIAMYDSCSFSQLSFPDKARRDELQSALAEVVNAPTIIPAEEGE